MLKFIWIRIFFEKLGIMYSKKIEINKILARFILLERNVIIWII